MKLDWRQGIIYLTIIGMEGSALYVLLTLLNIKVADGHLSILGLLLLYPAAFGFNRLLRWLRWHRIYIHALNTLAWGIATLLMIKAQLFSHLALSDPAWLLALPRAIANILYSFEPELLVMGGSAVLWWLGRRLAHIQVSFTTTISEFQFGLAAMLIVFFIAPPLEIQITSAVPVALIFSLSALLGISIAHAQEGAGWLTSLHKVHWSGLLLVSIGLILILGLIIGSVVTPDLLNLILIALKWIWGLIERMIAFLASLWTPEPSPFEPLPVMPMPQPDPSQEAIKLWTMPESVRNAIRLVFNIVFIGVFLVALWRISSQIFASLRRRLGNTGDAEIESLPGAFRADILSLLKRILLKLLGVRLLFRRQRKAEPHEITSVRQIYRQLLQWAASRGWARRMFQTPYEYLSILEKLLPASSEALQLITQHYINARYGLSLPSDEELLQLRQNWHQVKHDHLERPHSEDNNPK